MFKKSTQSVHYGYSEIAKTAIGVATTKQMGLLSARLHNRSGGAIDVAACVKLAGRDIKIYSLNAGVATDVSAAILAGTSTAVTTLVDNDGFLIGAKKLFNIAGLTVSQAASGGAPVFAYSYYNGSTFASLTPIVSATLTATGDKYTVFAAPQDFARGSGISGVDSGYFYIKCLATTAPTAAALKLSAVWLGQFLEYTEGVADNGELKIEFPSERPLFLEQGEGFMPYFATASASNMVSVRYAQLD